MSFGNVQNSTFMVNAPDSSTNVDRTCVENVVVTARANATGMVTSFATPIDDLGHVTC